MKKFIIVLSISLGLSCLSQAARKARAIFVQPPDSSLETAVLYTGTSFVEIALPQRNFSPEVELPDGDLLLVVLRSQPPAGQPIPLEAQKVKIPEAWTRCYLLFFPDESNKVTHTRVIAVNASNVDFPLGDTVIYNVSGAGIAAQMGDVIARVAPGKSAMVKAPVKNFGDYPVAIDCVLPGESSPTALCRSTWQHDPDARQVLFVTPNPGYKTPRVWGVLDRQTAASEKK